MSNVDLGFFGSRDGSVAPRRSALLKRLTALSQADSVQPEWRRSEPRHNPTQLTRLQLRTKKGRTLTGRLLNVTADGIGVLCSKCVATGEALEVRISDELALADSFRVVHATGTVGGFKLGLVLVDE